MTDILTLWQQNRDTMQIATMLHTDEATVYNALARMRGQRFYRPAEINAKVKAYSDRLRRAGVVGAERNRAIVKYRAELVNA